MPNLSPENVREKYLLYDNKIHTGKEAAESLDLLKESMKEIGYEIVTEKYEAALLGILQEYLYILCEFVEHGFETIGSKQRRLSNKMYKYSR